MSKAKAEAGLTDPDLEYGIDEDVRAILEEPFDEKEIQRKPGRGGSRPMAYISHGLVTRRLTQADPNWSSRTVEVYTSTESWTETVNGTPRTTSRLHCEGVLIEVTVRGVTRAEVGGPQRRESFTNEIKNAESDALKRAAMRFGIALSIWEELLDSEGDEERQTTVYQHERPSNQAQAQAQMAARQRPQTPAPAPSTPAGGRSAQRPQNGPQGGTPAGAANGSAQLGQNGRSRNAAQTPQNGAPAVEMVDRETGEIVSPPPAQGGAKFACKPEQIGEIRRLREWLEWDLPKLNAESKAAIGIGDVKLLKPEEADRLIAYMASLWAIEELKVALDWKDADVDRAATALFPEGTEPLTMAQREELIEFMRTQAMAV